MQNNLKSKNLLIIKTALPYMPVYLQQTLSYIVKIEEFEQMCNSLNENMNSQISICDEASKTEGLLLALKNHISEKEFEQVKMFINLTNSISNYNDSDDLNNEVQNQQIANNGLNIEIIKNMLNPNQKMLFDKYSSIINNSGGTNV